jgi:hypothetical protein
MLIILTTPVYAENFHVGYFLVKPCAMPGPQVKPEGVAVEYFELIAEKMGLSKFQFSLFPLKRLLMELEEKK